MEGTMAATIPVTRFTAELFALLEETFDNVEGRYLDGGTSLFETLATIPAEEASRPVSAHCASIAAQVDHTRFYLEVVGRYMRGTQVGKADWAASWRREHVTPDEWAALIAGLRATHQETLALLRGIEGWDGEEELGGALNILVHTAYHLGEIRQALCTVRA
jgi:hypothetical protein